ncbi:MAG: hypothetical protein IPH34_02765 [Chitinophagaceae bacterium]|nr:hypothetical protein [Chitinophagaceae bacterium]MBP6477865.1 hypothetical protein [Chitinophagaceae bacterium]
MKKYSILAVLAVLLLSCGGKIKLMVLLLLMKCVNAAKKVKGWLLQIWKQKKLEWNVLNFKEKIGERLSEIRSKKMLSIKG